VTLDASEQIQDQTRHGRAARAGLLASRSITRLATINFDGVLICQGWRVIGSASWFIRLPARPPNHSL
jgi:hypothetical protein